MKRLRDLLIAATLISCTASAGAAAGSGYPYQSCFEIASRMHEVPVDLLLAVASVESALNPDARSDRNAHGIMQIQWPGTAKHLGVKRVSELYNPCLNIELGARYLRELLDQSDGDVERALASYNYGPGRISRSPTLPDGARGYASKVAAHQSRISRRSAEQTRHQLKSLSADNPVRFDSKIRAERFAASLNERIQGADFIPLPVAEGGFQIRMSIREAGLSAADLNMLQILGWNNLGAP